MVGKVFNVFVEAIHHEIISWAPKPRFVFLEIWYPLETKGAQQVVLKNARENAGEKEGVEMVGLDKKKEVNVAEISWKKDGSCFVTYTYVIHQFKFEYGHINYTKVTSSENCDENDNFNT